QRFREGSDAPCAFADRRRIESNPMTRSISPPSSELHSEAAYWYNEKLAGDMTAEDEFRFKDWIARSPAHRKAYQTVDRGWNIAGMTEKEIHSRGDETSAQKTSAWHSRFALAAM